MVIVVSSAPHGRVPPWLGGVVPWAVVVGAAAAAMAFVAGWPYWRDHPAAAAVSMASCAGFAAAGLLMATARTGRRTGRLLLAAAAIWAVNWVAAWNVGPAPLIGSVAQATFFLTAGLAVLVYPSGRLHRLADRLWMAFAALILWGGLTATAVTSRPEWSGFDPAVIWPALVPDRATFREVLTVCGVLYLAVAGTLSLVILLRLPGMRPLERMMTLPVMLALAVVGVSGAVVQKPVMTDQITLSQLLNVYVLQGAFATAVPLMLLATALRGRLLELSVASRVLRLATPVSVRNVQAALRTVLRDPSLRLWFWSPRQRLYVGADGRATTDLGPLDADPAAPRWRQDVTAEGGRLLATVESGAFLSQHVALVRTALAASGHLLETAQLQAVLQADVAQVRKAQQRLMRAETEEREKLARDLHDGAQQRLLALGAMLATLETIAGDPGLADRIRSCQHELRATLAELRDLARGIQPPILREAGLGPALEVVAERLSTRVELDIGPRRFPQPVETALYFALCEALTNVEKHAQASNAVVRVRSAEDAVAADVRDDGVGGVPDAAPAGGGGLTNTADRVAALGGAIAIDSPAGEGTTVRIELPCA